ncbi:MULTISPECIES: hypothetical protein [Paracoccaceae]|uniref:hypothetical protein n=1 Tax=Rhodobacterales TaxID=204455 RepID=UPI001B148C47|nr:hypothetical protein [Boseongicola sp. H5]MBO6603214.1 hypothetical protein [Roseicyclus sp.]MBO6623646.1 hypothetical protein [Roseicyclus sp.]MBO6922900.1 hypothetical protein [Roseicyclus sp.]
MRYVAILMAACLAWPALASPVEPVPGVPERRELLNTLRPLVENDLGAPVEFMVDQLLWEDDRAFGRVVAQRPGGGQIDIATTPMVQRDGVSPEGIDGPRVEAFFRKTSEGWEVVTYEIGTTDTWFLAYDCANYGAFMREWGC